MNSEGNEKYYCSTKSTSIQPVQSCCWHRADYATSLVREFQSSKRGATLPLKVPPFDNTNLNNN